MDQANLPLPDLTASTVVVPPPGDGPGYWAGAPSAVLADDGTTYLAYRLRRPVGQGRGYANVVARSDDGERFETVLELHRDDFDCESLERPALVAHPGGGWRVYVSCATPETKHWRVDVLDAAEPAAFDPAARRPAFPGDEKTAVKDPVVVHHGGRWHLWLCEHPIEVLADADRMVTTYATSTDGETWDFEGVALAGRAGTWDERGTRVASVLMNGGPAVAYYDGRATFEQNWEERTGVAVESSPGRLRAVDDDPVTSEQGSGLRYVSAIALPDGGHRLYYEVTRADGAHELRTEYVPPVR